MITRISRQQVWEKLDACFWGDFAFPRDTTDPKRLSNFFRKVFNQFGTTRYTKRAFERLMKTDATFRKSIRVMNTKVIKNPEISFECSEIMDTEMFDGLCSSTRNDVFQIKAIDTMLVSSNTLLKYTQPGGTPKHEEHFYGRTRMATILISMKLLGLLTRELANQICWYACHITVVQSSQTPEEKANKIGSESNRIKIAQDNYPELSPEEQYKIANVNVIRFAPSDIGRTNRRKEQAESLYAEYKKSLTPKGSYSKLAAVKSKDRVPKCYQTKANCGGEMQPSACH